MFPNDDVYAWNEPVVTNPVPVATTLMVAAIEELITDTNTTLKKIYDFCSWTYFEHDLKNIVPKYRENDTIYNLIGLHDVHTEITKPDYNIILPLNIIHQCLLIQEKFNLKI